MKAVWEGAIIAQSDNTVVIENNHYFPPDSINEDYLQESETTSTCPWKGKASYYHLNVGGKINKDAAWYYAEPKDAAKEIKNHLAFWKGVAIKP